MFGYTTRTAAMTAALTAAAIMVVGTVAPVRAQNNTQDGTTDRLLACDGMTDPTEKLACFDAVVESLKQSPATPAVDSSSVLVPTSVPPPPTASAPNTESPDAPSIDVAPEPAAADTSSLPTDTLDAPTDTPATVVDNFGRDGMNAKTDRQENKDQEQDVEPIQATIVRSWRNSDGRFSVELDNGQVWRETQGTRVGLPKEGRSVNISKGRFGGYRMKIEKINQIAWVRRTK